MTSPTVNSAARDAAIVEGAAAVRWVPERRWTAVALLVGGVATLATSFAALPAPLLLFIGALWCVAVVWFASPASGTLGFTILSVCVKVTTLALIANLILDPGSPIGPQNAWYWVPLGFVNMGSGLWFLSLIRRRAR
jgi:hypothetical protein